MTQARMILPDTYGDGLYLREWRMGYDGRAEATYDAHVVADLSAAQIAEIHRRNELVHGGVAVLEAYRAAMVVPEPDADVPKTVDVLDEQGTVIGTEPHPAWAAYDAAQATIAALLAMDELPGDTPSYDLFERGEPQKLGEDGEPTAEWLAWEAARVRYPEVVANVLPDSPSVVDLPEFAA